MHLLLRQEDLFKNTGADESSFFGQAPYFRQENVLDGASSKRSDEKAKGRPAGRD